MKLLDDINWQYKPSTKTDITVSFLLGMVHCHDNQAHWHKQKSIVYLTPCS